MLEFIKKNKKIILNSSIFIGINNLNNNIFGQCSGKCRKAEDKNIVDSPTSESNNTINNNDNENPLEDKKPSEGKNPNKKNLPQNPSKSNFQIKKEQLLKKISDLEKLCPEFKRITSGCKAQD